MNISFVIPAYNAEKYIRVCLDSILSEKGSNDEIIVVDNGSEDATVKIAKSYNDVKLLVIPEVTVATLRNSGVESSRNELLAFIDADCVLCEGWRQRVINILVDKSVDATGSLYDIPEDACWIERAWFSQRTMEKGPAKFINSGNLVVKRKAFIDIGGFDDKLVSDEDCELGDRFNKAGYTMMEDPSIRVIHLGNPKTLKAFYKKELWHTTSALESQSLKTIDRPTIMSIIFGIMIMAALICLAVLPHIKVTITWCLILVLAVPFITSIYRGYQFKNYRYIPELTLLWGLAYIARLVNIGRVVINAR